MRVLRGRGESIQADRAATRRLVDRVADAGESALRVWYPHRHVAFGRRDASAAGYERARNVAGGRGYPPIERTVGGRAVAFTGDVLAFVRAEPRVPGDERAIDARYERVLATLTDGLADLGADVDRGEPPDSFCPGTHSLRAATAGGKVAGLAQRVRRDVAVVAGVVVVRDPAAVADVLAPVYDALGLPFDPESVGSASEAAGRALDPGDVRDGLESAFVGGRPTTTATVGDGP